VKREAGKSGDSQRRDDLHQGVTKILEMVEERLFVRVKAFIRPRTHSGCAFTHVEEFFESSL
jgi:hypothetical protein